MRRTTIGKVYALIVILALLSVTACSASAPEPGKDNSTKAQMKSGPFYSVSGNLPEITAPASFDWRQFKGTTLNFLVENNIYANILSKESEQFTKITGITVNIRPMDFSTMIEKINLDFISGSGKYQVVYADPYQTLNRFPDKLEDLNKFNNDPALPHLPGGIEDFFPMQIDVDSYFLNRDRLLTIPFDSTTMILYYRKDIFEKYKSAFIQDKGYDWTPGSKEFTWERYNEIASWITENVPKNEVKCGSGHMAKQHDSLYCDFSNVLAAYGGSYFLDKDVGGLGIKSPKEYRIVDKNFVTALKMYKKIIRSAAPESINWDWTELSEAFKAGDIAMMPNWDENESSLEDGKDSKVAGKIGYSILPYGSVRSANIFGGTGIGINIDARETEKRAAWLFILWSTCPQTELLVLKHPQGGVIPSRKSVYSDSDLVFSDKTSEKDGPGVQEILHLPTVLEAWKDENAYYRPKLGNSYEIEELIIKALHNMLKNDLDEEKTAKDLDFQIRSLEK